MPIIINYKGSRSETGGAFSRNVTAKMARLRLARKAVPTRKVSVISTRAPIINGPVNPPISATQKNMPPTDPIYREPTWGVSINMSTTRGDKEEPAIPNRVNPTSSGKADVVTDTKRAIGTNKANMAMNRFLRYGGTTRGITNMAGMLARRGIEAANPAVVGGRPPLSRILGSQLVNPCIIAKDKSPIIRTMRTFRTLISLLNTWLILVLSVPLVGAVSLANNHHSDATMKVSKP